LNLQNPLNTFLITQSSSERTDNVKYEYLPGPHFFYILVAASAVGKSDLMRQMQKEYLWESVPKYSSRDVRYKDGEIDDVVELDGLQIKDLPENQKAKARSDRIRLLKEKCGDGKGVVYYKNGNLYGIVVQEVLAIMQHTNAIAIISDFHAIDQLKTEFVELRNKIRILYIASSIDERVLLERYKKRETTDFNLVPEKEREVLSKIGEFNSVVASATRLHYIRRIEEVMPLLNAEWNSILPYFETIKTRSTNIRMLYNQYIENISVIDYSILNFYDLEYMYEQARHLLSCDVRERELNRKIKDGSPIFMVCAAPSSGKATLMEIIGDLGEVDGNIQIIHKYAQRSARENTDKRDGMIAIGRDGSFEEYIRPEHIWEWEFHKGVGKKGIKYAVDRSEIEMNFRPGRAQIFVSNMDEIENARKYYPQNIVVLYLHATHETETKNHIRAKCVNDYAEEIMKEMNCSMLEAEQRMLSDSKYKRSIDLLVKEKMEEIKKVHKSFLEHNYEIDHVLLNTGTKEDLVAQMRNLISFYTQQ